MFLQVSVCPERGWHAWWWACKVGEEGLGGRGHAWQGDMHGRGHVWQGGICGGGMCGRGHAWQGACVAGGHVWQGGMHGRRGVHGRYYEIRSMSERYASHWNAFLIVLLLLLASFRLLSYYRFCSKLFELYVLWDSQIGFIT